MNQAMLSMLELFRSMGFGALLGSGTFGVMFVISPNLFPGETSVDKAVILGALLGAGLHRLIERWVIHGMLHPITRFSTYYFRLAQLVLLSRIIGVRLQRDLIRELTRNYFLSSDEHLDGS